MVIFGRSGSSSIKYTDTPFEEPSRSTLSNLSKSARKTRKKVSTRRMKKKKKKKRETMYRTMETASESGRAPDQSGGGGVAAHPRRRVGHKNRKSADRRSPITENTAAVCGHTMRTMPSRCWIAITPVEGKPNHGGGGRESRERGGYILTRTAVICRALSAAVVESYDDEEASYVSSYEKESAGGGPLLPP